MRPGLPPLLSLGRLTHPEEGGSPEPVGRSGVVCAAVGGRFFPSRPPTPYSKSNLFLEIFPDLFVTCI